MGGKKNYELAIEIGYKSQPLKTKLPNGYTHKWSVYVKGVNDNKIEHCIQRVVFSLHDSFANPHREITEPPFQVKETGYAGFEIPIEIYFKNKEKPNHVVFVLDLVLLSYEPNKSSMIEKVSFQNPHKDFEKRLLRAGAYLLSVTKDKKERNDSPPPKKHKSSSLIPSKDMSKLIAPTQNHATNNHRNHSTTSSSQINSFHHHHQNHNQSGNNNFNNGDNHQTSTKPPVQQQSSQQKSKSTGPKEFTDLFGAPLVFNNKSTKSSSKASVDNDVLMTSNRSPHPPQQVSNNQSASQHNQTQSISHTSDHSNHHHHHKSHHKSHEKSTKSHKTPKPTNLNKLSHQERHSPSLPPPIQKSIDADDNPLQTIQARISSLSDCDRLQKIVDIIEEAGEWYNLTPTNKFEFDLKRLDRKTLSRIERCLQS